MDLIEFLLLLLINEFVIFAIWNLANKDMLLEFLNEWGKRHLPWWIRKPLYDCPPCMSSLHGAWFFLFMRGIPTDFRSFGWLCIYILALSGFSKIVVELVLERKISVESIEE